MCKPVWYSVSSLKSSSSLLSLSYPSDMVGGLGASSAMLSPVVQTVLQMGFEAGVVESLVQTKYLLTGQYYTSVSELVTDVLRAEEEERQAGPNSRGNRDGNKLKHSPDYCAFGYLSMFYMSNRFFFFSLFLPPC